VHAKTLFKSVVGISVACMKLANVVTIDAPHLLILFDIQYIPFWIHVMVFVPKKMAE